MRINRIASKQCMHSSSYIIIISGCIGVALTADIDDHFQVIDQLLDIISCWKQLGAALGINRPKLDEIEKKYPADPRGSMEEVISEWLNQSYKTERFGLPSWKTLVAAVAHRSGGNNNALARKIATKYNG